MGRTKIVCYCLGVVLAMGSSGPLHGQLTSAMTYNIRYDNPGDGPHQWSNRKAELVALLHHYAPTVLGLQEGLLHQLDYLDAQLPQYARIGVGRDDGKTKGEFSAIYYKPKALALLTASTFWLSPQDDRVSVGWDASMERICTYGLFEVKATQQKIWVFNAHFDHIGKIAREQSSRLILKKIAELNPENHPVLVMGDFNAPPESQAIAPFIAAFGDLATTVPHGIYGPQGTFTGFEENATAQRRIDYIFASNLMVTRYRHIDDKRKNNHYLSDHLPVQVTFQSQQSP